MMPLEQGGWAHNGRHRCRECLCSGARWEVGNNGLTHLGSFLEQGKGGNK